VCEAYKQKIRKQDMSFEELISWESIKKGIYMKSKKLGLGKGIRISKK
jgi:hypothetical protein